MKSPQVLRIEPPSQLVFKGPFHDVVTCYMRLTNPTDRRVCFKVKTTAPKRYCVRPNVGIIDPGETNSVAVMLQPMDESKNDLEQANHKFLVQSVFAPPGDISLENIWTNVQPTEVMDSKLLVVLESPSSTNTYSNDVPANQTDRPRIAVQVGGVGHAVDVDPAVLSLIEGKKKAESAKADLEKDYNNLKARLAALESIPQAIGSQTIESGIAVVQVVLIAIGALLIGLILGKLF